MAIENKTEQEKFWEGEFGEDYIYRNDSTKLLASNIALFSDSLSNASGINTVMEFGANIGLNLRAIHQILPSAVLNAVEINEKAVAELESWLAKQPHIMGGVHHQSFLSYEVSKSFDLVLVKTVLIHINPDKLNEAYQKIYESTEKYILIAEYYNPSPVSVSYRNFEDKLFKRDFAGDMLRIYPDLTLKNYGFRYHLDPNFPQDDINWFLLEKIVG